jgi:hypothetical protein
LIGLIKSVDTLNIDHKRLLVQLYTLNDQFNVAQGDILANKELWTTVKALVSSNIQFITVGLDTFGIPVSPSAYDAARIYARLLAFVAEVSQIEVYNAVHKNRPKQKDDDWDVWLLEEIAQGLKNGRHVYRLDTRHQLKRCLRHRFDTGHDLYDITWTNHIISTTNRFFRFAQQGNEQTNLNNLSTFLHEVVTAMCDDFIKRGGLVEEGRMGSDGIVSALGQVFDGLISTLFNNNLDSLLEVCTFFLLYSYS